MVIRKCIFFDAGKNLRSVVFNKAKLINTNGCTLSVKM